MEDEERIITEKNLFDKMRFNTNLPKKWSKAILDSEVNLQVGKRIHDTFGSLGLYLYTKWTHLDFLEIDKTAVEDAGFFKPLMIFMVNILKQQ